MKSPKRKTKNLEPVLGAGGVVFDAQNQVLLICYPKSQSWSFPKGHIENGESTQQAALREVLEEGGVQASVIAPLASTTYHNPKGVLRQVHWFVMRTNATQASAEPGFQAGFYDITTAKKLLSHEQNQQLLEQALGLVAQ